MRGFTAVAAACALMACNGGEEDPNPTGRCPKYEVGYGGLLPDLSSGAYCCGLDEDLAPSDDQQGCYAAWTDSFSGRIYTQAPHPDIRVVIDTETGRRGIQGISYEDSDGDGPAYPTAVACSFVPCIE
jgi:hypothetical protein